MEKRTIRALMVAPKEHPRSIRLPLSYKSFMKAVSIGCPNLGWPKVRKLETGVYVLYNDDGFPMDLPGNRYIADMVICGVCYIIVADEEGRIISLPDDVLCKYRKLLWEPEDISGEELIQAYLDDLSKTVEEIEILDPMSIYY